MEQNLAGEDRGLLPLIARVGLGDARVESHAHAGLVGDEIGRDDLVGGDVALEEVGGAGRPVNLKDAVDPISRPDDGQVRIEAGVWVREHGQERLAGEFSRCRHQATFRNISSCDPSGLIQTAGPVWTLSRTARSVTLA